MCRSACEPEKEQNGVGTVIGAVSDTCSGVYKYGQRCLAAGRAACFWGLTYVEVGFCYQTVIIQARVRMLKLKGERARIAKAIVSLYFEDKLQ